MPISEVYNTDCMEYMKSIPDKFFDLAIVDPPYGINAPNMNMGTNMNRKHAQPYRDLNNPRQILPQWQKDLAGWVDKKWIFRTCEFKDFEPRKGFRCKEYFDV